MRVLCVIDHFGSGGAQRQLVELACGLQRHGHEVEAFCYFPEHDFFYPRLASRGIVVHRYPKNTGSPIGLIRELRSLVHDGRYDVLVSYMNTPNAYAEIATLFARPSTRLVVSERCTHHEDTSLVRSYARRALHAVADCVVTNSVTHMEWLKQHRWLRDKTHCIYNGFTLDEYAAPPRAPQQPQDLQLIGIGRVVEQKNVVGLARACGVFFRRYGWMPIVRWVGRSDDTPADVAYLGEVERILEQHPEVAARWQWLGERRDVPQLLAAHDALILPSLYEGLPNAVCEALASARPVLASSICDNPRLVASGERGFIFDPDDPEAIAESMHRLASLSQQEWISFGHNARAYAERELSVERMVARYEDIFDEIRAGVSPA